MKQIHLTFIVLLVMASLFGCSDDNNPMTTASDLTGSWVATKIEFTNNTNSSQKEDLISQGASAVLIVEASARFSSEVIDPDGIVETDAGVMILRGKTLVFISEVDNDETIFQFSYSSDVLSLSKNDDEFDFDGDGIDEPASLDAVLVRN